jgi:4-amino-4-deoxy-L-arabinose transferase-like glycosyltransferase
LPRRPSTRPRKNEPTKPVPIVEMAAPSAEPFWTGARLTIAVLSMLSLHVVLAVYSLVQENPTVDEVIHLPAGVTYWQTGTFRLYHHNPPLVKLVAALPLLVSGPAVDYTKPSWKQEPPNKAAFAHEFMYDNAARYFELFARARLLMPLFSVIGGLVVFAWSRRLYGASGGLLSLALWTLCPNVLAHTRLVTTDMGATALGALAMFVFWLYLKAPSWRLAAISGLCLGLAQLTKFSMIILYGLWPLLAAVRLATDADARRFLPRTAAHALLVVLVSILVIDLGYGFEGVGIPLGEYEFVCQTFTKPVPPGVRRPRSPDQLLDGAYRFRINRFRGTALGLLPVPLPKHYMLGFDDQKLEAEGIPNKFLADPARPPGSEGDKIQGYPVYLDGKLSQKSWWYYYLMTLVYKLPEGTWALVAAALAAMAFSKRSRATWFDELAVLTVPVFVLFVMSVLTNINLGLRYVLPIFPFLYVGAGKLAPWTSGFHNPGLRRSAWAFVGISLTATAATTAYIHPHYLAYFNALSGGPDRGAEHLIDSNIDWGQDLVGLRKWLAANAPDERVGLAYFGQVNPRVFEARGNPFDWFLPPPMPGTMPVLPVRYQIDPDAMRLKPGLYAVSATLVEGLPWRVYDSPSFGPDRTVWSAPMQAWFNAFGYFRDLEPFEKVGYSIYLYRVTPEQAERLAHYWDAPASVR